MKKIIQKQRDNIIAELCQKIVALKWSERMVEETPEDIKNIGDITKLTDEQTKADYKQYQQDLQNVNTNKLHIEADIFAYRALDNIEKEIKEKLCIR